jgi:peroxiredoxin
MLRGFPGYQCPYCTAQVGEFISRIKDFQAMGANIIAVYPGPAEGLVEHAKDFVRGKSLPANFYLVLDPDCSFTNAYGLRWDAPQETAYPATFLIDRAGTVRFATVFHFLKMVGDNRDITLSMVGHFPREEVCAGSWSWNIPISSEGPARLH